MSEQGRAANKDARPRPEPDGQQPPQPVAAPPDAEPRIIKCVVDSILWATAQGQMPISGNLQNTLPVAVPEHRIAVRLVLAPKDRQLFLAAGARGGGAIYTEHGKMIHIVRKVFLRVSAKVDWFVWKLH